MWCGGSSSGETIGDDCNDGGTFTSLVFSLKGIPVEKESVSSLMFEEARDDGED